MSDCLFCHIANGHAPAEIRASNDSFLAFDDLYPKAETHVLIIPREHTVDLDEWVAGASKSPAMIEFVQQTAAELGVAGNYRLLTNVGRNAGQMIFHMHWHLMSGDIAAF